MDYEKLRALLEEQEKFPLDFIVKFIGRNTERFEKGILVFEAEYPSIRLVSRRPSAHGAHLALTYTYVAESAEAAILILKRVSRIDDVQVVL